MIELFGLFKSGAPFNGAISFLLTSPILNPAILTLMLAFFGIKATIIYTIFTFAFAVIMGLVLDKAGFEKEVKNVTVKGGHQDGISWETLQGTFWQRQWQAIRISLKDAFGLFRGVVIFLILGAGIGAFIYEFIPTDLLANFAGASIPEVSLLSSIFKKKMVVAFVLSIFAVATITGYVFNIVL